MVAGASPAPAGQVLGAAGPRLALGGVISASEVCLRQLHAGDAGRIATALRGTAQLCFGVRDADQAQG